MAISGSAVACWSPSVRAAGMALAVLLVSCGLEAAPPAATEPPTASDHPGKAAAVGAPAPQRPVGTQTTAREADERVDQSEEPTIESAGAIVSRSVARVPDEVRSAHVSQVERMKCGDRHVSYPPEFDDWHRIDLDGDGAAEHLVFLTLEGFGGGNNYSRYLIIYRYVDPVWFASTVLHVGGKGDADVSGETVRLTGATLSTRARFYGPQDPMCCATVPGQIHFRVGIGGVLEPTETQLTDEQAAYRFMLLYAARCTD